MIELRLKIAKSDIKNLFNKLRSNVMTHSEICEILNKNREFWRVTESTTCNDFIEFLLKETTLKKVKFKFPYRNIIRYIWGEASIYKIILSLKPDSYFTHYSAMYLHELTEQIPKTIYLNFEQSSKPKGSLAQERIDAAFKRPWRVTNNISTYKDYKICLLNGMYTGKLGVIEMVGPEEEKIFVTNIERTLIDIVVKPIYSGGVFEVLKAYKLASERVSINKLAAMLKKLDYIYPYHQAIGFYLEKSGVYKETQIDLMKNFKIEYDFYLTHQMKNISYSKEWRLYFPKGF